LAFPSRDWIYDARAKRVIDGDTIEMILDKGFEDFSKDRVRLLGLDTPETQKPTKAAGDAATNFVVNWLADAYVGLTPDQWEWPLRIQTRKSDVFGRYLATVWRFSDGRCLNEDLLAAGHAVVDIR